MNNRCCLKETDHIEEATSCLQSERNILSVSRRQTARLGCLRAMTVCLMIIIASSFTASGTGRQANWNKEQYRKYLSHESEWLLKEGERFLLDKWEPDSALMCYTIVTDRYSPDMNKSEMEVCLEGYYGRWQTFFFGYGNPALAMDDLLVATELARKVGKAAPKLDYFYGACYMSIGVSVDSEMMFEESKRYFRRSFHNAYKLKDYRTMHRSFDNLATLAYLQDSLQCIAEEVNLMRQLKEPEMWRKAQSLEIYRGFELQESGDMKGALESFGRLLRNTPRLMENMRYVTSFYYKRSRVENELGMYDEMKATLDTIMTLTYKYRFPDIRQSVLNTLRDYYRMIGDNAKAVAMDEHFYALKDSLMQDFFLATFQEVHFNSERNSMKSEMNAIRYESRLKGWILLLSGILLGLTVIFVIVLRRSNRRLRQRTDLLYQQMRQSLEQKEEWIGKPVVMLGQVDETEEEEMDDSISAAGTKDEAETGAADDDEEKYAGSALTDAAMDDLAERIRNVILHSPAIFDSEFSLGKLADDLGSNRKYVSQTINARFNSNFWTLVNQARVREAMRRLDDKAGYGNYSIEGIAESVGFRSRSTFSTWFKRFTGLGAAEYRQLGGKK